MCFYYNYQNDCLSKREEKLKEELNDTLLFLLNDKIYNQLIPELKEEKKLYRTSSNVIKQSKIRILELENELINLRHYTNNLIAEHEILEKSIENKEEDFTKTATTLVDLICKK